MNVNTQPIFSCSHYAVVFVKDSVLFCLWTKQRARGMSASARVRFAKGKPIHFGSQ